MKLNKEEIFYIVAAFFFGISIMLSIMQLMYPPERKATLSKNPDASWQIESIDTMKYSRDEAKQGLTDKSYAVLVNKQIEAIASTGANYVAIDTPYDAEFLPVLKLWVRTARDYGLHVWFRGNFSGWEGWFNYPQITEQQHIDKTRQFILNNANLFQDGDIFTSCPECENGAHLNPTDANAVVAYRKFLITEYNSDNQAFAKIDKKVNNGYFSMNADVAQAVMDKQTTKALGGIVVIDHYVPEPQDLLNRVNLLASESGGKVVLGEFGVPIPNLNGNMTDEQQRAWIAQALHLLTTTKSLLGVNYWVSYGGSTALWNDNDTPKPAVAVITKYFKNNP